MIRICSFFHVGGKYLYVYYKTNKVKKDKRIESSFIKRYPELNISHAKNKKIIKHSSFLGHKDSFHIINEVYNEFSLSLRNNDFHALKVLWNKLLSRYPLSDETRKAFVLLSKNNIKYYQSNRTEIINEIYNLIEGGKHNNFLVDYYLSVACTNSDSELHKSLDYFYYTNPNNSRLLTLLGDMASKNNDLSNAANYYSLLSAYKPQYGLSKLISLYCEHGKIPLAENKVADLLGMELSDDDIYRIVPMILRVAPLLGDIKFEVFKWKRLLFEHISLDNLEKKHMDAIVRCRYMPAYDLLSKDTLHSCGLNREEHETILNLFYLAYRNDENITSFECIKNRVVRHFSLDEIDDIKDNVIELFIPTVFFNLDDSKLIYSTIRTFYINLIEILIASEYTILPRMQYNWRNVDKKTSSKAICYHSKFNLDRKDNIVIQESTLSGRLSIDPVGYAGFSHFANVSSCANTEVLNKESLLYLDSFMKNKTSKYNQSEVELISDSDFVFFPLQVENDVVSILRHVEIQDALNVAIKFTKENGLKLIIKRHPCCQSSKIHALIVESLEFDHVEESDASIHSLIEKAKIIVTANSGVGLEAVLYSKPIVVFGRSDYSKVVFEAISPDELYKYLIELNSIESVNYNHFINEYICSYTVDANDKVKIKYRIFALLRNKTI
ncbi:MAG: hypothetical protein R3Y10_05125 [Ferrimonas sp.]